MVPKSFEVGELVWAKMKGYSPWPGTIADPPSSTKSPKAKKCQHYVFFFGSNNYAWIPDDSIFLHSEKMIEKYGKSNKKGVYQTAVEEIIQKSKDISKGAHKVSDSQSNENVSDVDEQGNGQSSSKKISFPSEPSSSKTIKKKEILKKSSSAKIPVRKRSVSSEADSEAETDEYSFSSKYSKMMEESYANLLAHIPPNIGLEDLPMPTPSTSVLPKRYVRRTATPPLDFQYDSDFFKVKEKVEPCQKKIGFIGLGNLGQGIVKNLAKTGHSLLIWDKNPGESHLFQELLSVPVADTPFDVITASDITFCCLSDLDDAKSLLFGNCGILKGLESCTGENKDYVEMTYMDTKVSLVVAEEFKLRGGRFLEAPITGTRTDAIEASLVITAAGDKSLYDDCNSCFTAISKKHMFVSSEIGAATKLSTVNNALVGAAYAAFAEALALICRAGLRPEDLLEIMQSGVMNNVELINKGLAMVTNDYTTNTSLKHMQRFLQFGLDLGDEVGQPTPVLSSANEIYKHCKFMRYGDHDVGAVYEGTYPLDPSKTDF